MPMSPPRKALACLGSLFVSYLSAVRGNEVYLSRITIYKTLDPWFFPPTVYFKCPDDDRKKRFLSDVKATNHTYIVHPEAVALTHVSSEYCQSDCGVYDQDLFDGDDIFGHTFKLCDDDFDEENHLFEVELPGEVTLELYCPQCNHVVAPPPSPEEIAKDGDAANSSAQSMNATAEEELEKLLPKGENVEHVLIAVILGAVLLGFLLGVVAHRCCRAFSDVAAEDARTRFQALYADPNTEIEDLPSGLPGRRNTGLNGFARSIRGILGRGGSAAQQPAAPRRVGDPVVPFHQLKVQEADIDEA